MGRKTWAVSSILAAVMSAAVYTQNGPTPREPSWAFPTNTAKIAALPAGPLSLDGSDRKFTAEQIDDWRNPPDWFPNDRPDPPPVIIKGSGTEGLACGSCHLMSGSGHPESSDMTGLSANYIIQQMADFKAGTRKDFARMNPIAQATSDADVKAAAEWFAKLKPQKFVRVVEQAEVPKTIVAGGRMRFLDPKGGTEPIGNRILAVPENEERARKRDPRSGFVAYVPPGSIAKGKALVDTGGNGKTIACGLCHGGNMEGLGNIPRLRGQHPSYTARQMYLFKEGTRAGADAGLMTPVAANLTDEDILNISAYLGSL